MSRYSPGLQLALLAANDPGPAGIVGPYVQAELIRGSVGNPYGYGYGFVNPYPGPYGYGYPGVPSPYGYGYPGVPNPYYWGYYR
jgi:hypothetical protein